ncbi:hypothetical protein C8R44DRAFT_893747 [Mycena epipterygia]|nr:hypothetical protein C8R44DRAFT_893747 [Mycena epipterygia]
MGSYSKARKARTANLFQNLTNRTKRAWDELGTSPKKIRKWFSPRKKHKEDTMDDTDSQTRIGDASDVSIHAFDASDDPFQDAGSMQSFQIPGFTSESPSVAPRARRFTWKVPKPTVEEVEDEDDRLSTHTFPTPDQPEPLPSSSAHSPYCDPLDSIDVPEADDELLATSPSHDDNYPRPCATRGFLDRMNEQATRAGRYLHGELRGTDLWGRRGVGYKDPDISAFTRNRLIGIQTMLNFYTTQGLEGGTYARWGSSARLAAHGLGRGKHCARVLAALARQFILTREVLDVNPYGEWNETMLADEDLANDIRLHLQSLGKEITAEKLVNYLNDLEVRVEHNIDKPVSLTTARRYLDELGYRFMSPKKGQYVDGHERPDVVYYRDNIYLPRLFDLNKRVFIFDNDGNPPR